MSYTKPYQDDEFLVWMNTPRWVRLRPIDFISLEYKRVLNAVGILKITLPFDFEPTLLVEESILEVWRGLSGQFALDMETVWFLKKKELSLDDNGRETIVITASDANSLLDSRIVDSGDGPQDYANTPGDDMMKAYVRTNLGPDAATLRQIHTLDVQADFGIGPSLDHTTSGDRVLGTLQDISQDSAKQGTQVFFDVVCPSRGQLQFRTYLGSRGANRGMTSSNRLVLSPKAGTLSDVLWSYDVTNEKNRAYVAGKDHVVLQVSDPIRETTTIYSRREVYLNRGNVSSEVLLAAEGRSVIRDNRPREIFQSSIQNTAGIRYGRDWGFGSIVAGEYRGRMVSAMVDAIHVKVERGKSITEARLNIQL